MRKTDFYKSTLKTLLFEQEEDEAADEGEAEEAEEETDEEGTEEEDEEAEEDQENVVVDSEPSLDGEIEAVLIDFETTARKSAVKENKTLRVLYEAEEVLDLDSFSADVARLVKNYDNLIDMEALLINKTKDFLESRYGEEAVSQFIDKLEQQHDIEDPTTSKVVPTNDQTPLAVGAGVAGE